MHWSFHLTGYELFDFKRAQKYVHTANNPKALKLHSFLGGGGGITNSELKFIYEMKWRQ